MSDLTVAIDGWDALGKNLERAKENLDGALEAMEDIGPDSIGPDDLDDACAEFRDDWERGLDKVGGPDAMTGNDDWQGLTFDPARGNPASQSARSPSRADR